jgi:hypothetical protein
MLLIHGERTVAKTSAGKSISQSAWALTDKKECSIATVAVANKNVCIIWAILSRKAEYKERC